jgi:hypothetical protein
MTRILDLALEPPDVLWVPTLKNYDSETQRACGEIIG